VAVCCDLIEYICNKTLHYHCIVINRYVRCMCCFCFNPPILKGRGSSNTEFGKEINNVTKLFQIGFELGFSQTIRFELKLINHLVICLMHLACFKMFSSYLT
jgi:hypothetical protein